jgi:hypothetical protein
MTRILFGFIRVICVNPRLQNKISPLSITFRSPLNFYLFKGVEKKHPPAYYTSE